MVQYPSALTVARGGRVALASYVLSLNSQPEIQCCMSREQSFLLLTCDRRTTDSENLMIFRATTTVYHYVVFMLFSC